MNYAVMKVKGGFIGSSGIPGNAVLLVMKKYSSSLDPLAMRLMTSILLLIPSSTMIMCGRRQ